MDIFIFINKNLGNTTKFFIILFIIFIITKYSKKYLVKAMSFIGKHTIKDEYLASFLDNPKMLSIAVYLIPLLVIDYFVFYSSFPKFEYFTIVTSENIKKWIFVANTFSFLYWLSNFLSHSVDYLKDKDKYKHKPLHGLGQIIFIVFFMFSAAILYARFTHQSPTMLFTTLSVVSMAIFLTLKDIILGIISTMLIIMNDIVRVGDWIQSEKHHADGIIKEINLITVKVENQDKSICVIPTYHLVSDGFNNMENILRIDSQMIRIVFRIAPESIHYMTESNITQYEHIELLADHIRKNKERHLESMNKQENKSGKEYIYRNELVDESELPLTNLGLFRKYLEKYILNHPMTSRKYKNETVVRIVEGVREGVGLEIECFVKTANRNTYEHYQSTLMEHVYASAGKFEIVVNC